MKISLELIFKKEKIECLNRTLNESLNSRLHLQDITLHDKFVFLMTWTYIYFVHKIT